MLRTIVEGEPGAFPEPVARIMRGIGGLFRRKPAGDRPNDATPDDGPTAFDPSTLDPSRPRGPDEGGADEGTEDEHRP